MKNSPFEPIMVSIALKQQDDMPFDSSQLSQYRQKKKTRMQVNLRFRVIFFAKKFPNRFVCKTI